MNPNITTRAALIHRPGGPIVLEDLTLNDLRDDEVLVKLVATGVCHTDVSFIHRPFLADKPIILGHEGAGYVEAVGSKVSSVKIGDPVVLSFDACGQCESCQEDHPAYCHAFVAHNFLGQRADGSTAWHGDHGPVRHAFFGQSSFATRSVCRASNVVKLATDADLELMGPLGCGLQTGAGAVLNVLKPSAGQSIAIFGAGSVGLAAVMAAKALDLGCIVAIDIKDSRLEMAKSLGATHVINAKEGEDVVAQVKAACAPGMHYTLDTTANMAILRQATEVLRHRGTCGFVGGATADAEICVNSRDMMINGKTLKGIIEGDADPHRFIPALIDMYRAGQFPMDKLVRYYPLESIHQAIEDAESGAAIKAILTMPT